MDPPTSPDTTPDADDEPTDPLEARLVECLRRFELGGEPALAEFLKSVPADRAALERRLEMLRGLGLLQPSEKTARIEAPAALPETIGDFRLLGRLGEGGMGVVHLAEQTSLGRLVALKLIRGGAAGSPAAVARFRREASSLARLRHPHLTAVYGAGEDAGVRWIAMEFIDGSGLDQLVREAGERGRTLEPRLVATWARDLARALAVAHEAGVIHRDVKPSNIKIASDGRARLLDFGLARDLGAETLSISGSFIGSPQYAAPEQVRGEHAAVGPASDVYGLGATLYDALTGRPPFAGATTEELFRRILAEDPPSPRALAPGVPRDLACVVSKALEKNPAHRYATAQAFADDLDAVLTDRPTVAKPPGPWLRLAKWSRRKPGPAAAIGVGVVALCVASAVFALDRARAADARRTEAAHEIAAAGRALARYRALRAAAADEEGRAVLLGNELFQMRTTPEHDAELTRVENLGRDRRRDREAALFDALSRLERAERLEHPDGETGRLRAEIYAERFAEALSAGDPATAAFWKAEAELADVDGAVAARWQGARRLSVATEPPGATVHLFRYVEGSSQVGRGEPRLIPVPERGGTEIEPRPGTTVLRIARDLGELREGDFVTSLAGEPPDGAVFVVAADDDAVAAIGSRLVAIDGAPVAAPVEIPWILDGRVSAPAKPNDGGHVFRFRLDGREEGVLAENASDLGLRLGTAVEAAACGGLSAIVFRDGLRRDVVLPAGTEARPTATPLTAAPAGLLGVTPVVDAPLVLGDYLVLVRKPGFAETRLGARLGDPFGAQSHSLFVRLVPAADLPTGFVHVATTADGGPLAFAAAETTHAEYAVFLDAVLATQGPAARRARSPRDGTGALHWPLDPQGNPRPRGEHLRLPVYGVDWDDATAYARWRTETARAQDSRWTFRLPTLDEYGAAGASPEGRRFVFGSRFRPKFIASNFRRAFPAPEQILSAPIDESPFGVHDLAGSVSEWLDGWNLELRSLRPRAGGSWAYGEASSFTTYFSQGARASYVDAATGFRIVATRAP